MINLITQLILIQHVRTVVVQNSGWNSNMEDCMDNQREEIWCVFSRGEESVL